MSDSSKYWEKPADPHTIIKSNIVAKYFMVWSRIIRRRGTKIAYLDLYAGSGEHEGGDLSTAVQVMNLAIKDEFLKDNLVVILNDIKPSNCNNMRMVLSKFGYDNNFSIKPKISTLEVNLLLAKSLDQIKLLPMFCFIDPYGYKGLSIKLIRAIIKDWGCDCVIFFHTSGINRNLLKPNQHSEMLTLFGTKTYNKILDRILNKNEKRCDIILEEFQLACSKLGAKYFLPLKFYRKNSRLLSHHLIYLSKHHRGFGIMKDIMSTYSRKRDTIPLYEYIEGCEGTGDEFTLNVGMNEMEKLKMKMINTFHRKKISVKNIVDSYHIGGQLYTEKNIKDALDQMELDGRINEISQNKRKRRKGQFGNDRIVEFP